MKLKFQLVGSVGVDFIAPDRAESGGDWRKKQHLDRQMPWARRSRVRHATPARTWRLLPWDREIIDYIQPFIKAPPGVAVG